jgi:hypothetical protein
MSCVDVTWKSDVQLGNSESHSKVYTERLCSTYMAWICSSKRYCKFTIRIELNAKYGSVAKTILYQSAAFGSNNYCITDISP